MLDNLESKKQSLNFCNGLSIPCLFLVISIISKHKKQIFNKLVTAIVKLFYKAVNRVWNGNQILTPAQSQNTFCAIFQLPGQNKEGQRYSVRA